MLSVYICEDEEEVRRIQRECLEKQIMIQGYDMEIALCSGRPGEILEAVEKNPGRGIYFLDVELKGEEMDGFALGREIRRLDPRGFIVYVTAYGNLAFETFRYHLEALDYIVKESMEKMEEGLGKSLSVITERMRAEQGEHREFFSVKVMDVVKHVPIDEIMFFEAAPGTHRIALHGVNDWFDFIGSLRELEGQQILYGYLWAAGFFLFCEKFVDHEDFEWGVKLLTLAFVSLYAVLLYLYRTKEDGTLHRGLAVMALTIVVAECTVNTYVTSLGTVSRSAYLGQQEDYRWLYEAAREREAGFYRLEKFTRKTKNDGTLTGYPTASVFSSTMNSQVMDLYKRLGMRHSKVYYGFDGATALTSALLNVHYMFGESEKYENALYTLLDKSGDIFLYQCNASLPFGYVAPVGFDLDPDEAKKGFRLQNQMAEELGAEGKLFRREDSEVSGDDVKFTAREGGFYYAVLTASGTGKVDYIGGSTGEEAFKDLKNGSILYLGYLERDQTVTLTNGDDEDATPGIEADVYSMDREVLGQVLERLSAQHMENVEWESDRIAADLVLEQPGRVICSIPYEDGWTVRINGEKTEGVLFGGCLMAFDLEAGEYSFEMEYVPAGAWAGIAVSAVSILAFILLMLRRGKSGEKEAEQETLP